MVDGIDLAGFLSVLFPVLGVVFGAFFIGLFANMAIHAA